MQRSHFLRQYSQRQRLDLVRQWHAIHELQQIFLENQERIRPEEKPNIRQLCCLPPLPGRPPPSPPRRGPWSLQMCQPSPLSKRGENRPHDPKQLFGT